MVSKLFLCFLNVIQISAAFEFQSDPPTSFSSFHTPSLNQIDTPTNKQVKNVASAKEQQSRLQKMEELVEKQEERMGQLNESLQGKLSQVQDQMLAKMQASQLEEKSHLATIEEKLHQLDGRLVAFENASSELDSETTTAASLTVSTVHNKKPKVNFTTIQNVGLSFALVMEEVPYSKMDKYCAELVDSGRMIVLDSKSKLEALKTHLANISEKKGNFYVGLRRSRHGRHLWSNGEEIDHAFWCNTHVTHKNTCGAIKLRARKDASCIGAVRCTEGRIICENPL